jgi:hypothetical protein
MGGEQQIYVSDLADGKDYIPASSSRAICHGKLDEIYASRAISVLTQLKLYLMIRN